MSTASCRPRHDHGRTRRHARRRPPDRADRAHRSADGRSSRSATVGCGHRPRRRARHLARAPQPRAAAPGRRDGDQRLADCRSTPGKVALAERVDRRGHRHPHRGGPGRRRLQRDARPRRRAPSTRGTRASSGCASSSPTPRTSCARRSPRSRGMPSCRAASPTPVPADGDPRDGPDRVRGQPDELARRGPAAARPPRRRPAARARRPSTCRCSSSTRSATRTPHRPATAGTSTCRPSRSRCTGDSARLHQVVANLLANARTHTPAGTRVTTSVRPEGEWVRVAVHDDGPGVPEALQPNVFERFARGDDARVRAGGSTGLGLSIVAAVSKAHGGRVELDSRPGDTTFSRSCSPPAPDRRAVRTCRIRTSRHVRPSRLHRGDSISGAKVAPQGRHSRRPELWGHGHDDPHLRRRRPRAAPHRRPSGRRTPAPRPRTPPAVRVVRAGSSRLWRGPGRRPAWARPALLGLLLATLAALHWNLTRERLGELLLLRRGPGRQRELEGLLLRQLRRRATRSPSTSRRPPCG